MRRLTVLICIFILPLISSAAQDEDLFTAVKKIDHDALAKILRNSTNINVLDQEGQTPLIALVKLLSNLKDNKEASMKGHIMLDNLIGAGADPDFQDKTGQDALMYAILGHNNRESLNISRSLIYRMTNLDARNIEGDTALMIAIHKQKHRVVKLLLDKGASAHLRNNKGLDAYDLSTQYRTLDRKNKRMVRISRMVHGINDVKMDISGKNVNSQFFEIAASKALKMRGWMPSVVGANSITGNLSKNESTFKVNIKRVDDLVSFVWVPGYENTTPNYLQNLRSDFRKIISLRNEISEK